MLIKEECILKNKNKSCPYKKLSVVYNSCLKTFGSHLVYIQCAQCRINGEISTLLRVGLVYLDLISMCRSGQTAGYYIARLG